MAKTLDFNKINRPTLQLVMPDEAKTVIKVTTPKESMVEELQAILPELQNIVSAGDAEATRLCYDLAARLINCNRSFITVTAEELRDKYNLDLEGLIVFYSTYIDFVQEINNAKN